MPPVRPGPIAAIVLFQGFIGLGFLLGSLQAADPLVPTAKAPEVPCDVWSIAVSPNGKVVAAGAGWWDQQPGEIGIWDLATGQPLRRYPESRGIGSVIFSPDSKLLISGNWEHHVSIRDWAARQLIADLNVSGGGVVRLAVSPEGQHLLTVTEAQEPEFQLVQLWELPRGRQHAILEDGDHFCFHVGAFSPDGKRILAGGGNREKGKNWVVGWDVDSKKQTFKLSGHGNAILSLVYSPDGNTIATGSVDATVRLWEADNGNPLHVLVGHRQWVEGLAFTQDGKTLVSGSQDGTVRFWDVHMGRERVTERMNVGFGVRAVRFGPDGKTLYVGGGRKMLKVYNHPGHKEVQVLWNGLDSHLVLMDDLPATKEEKPLEKLWFVPALIGLIIAIVLLFLLAWSLLRRRRQAKKQPDQARTVSASIEVLCPGCKKKLKARPDLLRKRAKCPHCGQMVDIPETTA